MIECSVLMSWHLGGEPSLSATPTDEAGLHAGHGVHNSSTRPPYRIRCLSQSRFFKMRAVALYRPGL